MRIITCGGLVLFESGIEELILIQPLDLKNFQQLDHYLVIPVNDDQIKYEKCKKLYNYVDKQLCQDAWQLNEENDDRSISVFVPVSEGFFDFAHMLCYAFRFDPSQDQLEILDIALSASSKYHINIEISEDELATCIDRFQFLVR
jgi:hypothetical protein